VSVPGNGCGGCNREARGISCRTHPQEDSCGGVSEIDMDHGTCGRHGAESGGKQLRILVRYPMSWRGPYIGDTAHSGALELSSIKLIDSSLQVSCSFEFNEP
jgi:hypothetical protein